MDKVQRAIASDRDFAQGHHHLLNFFVLVLRYGMDLNEWIDHEEIDFGIAQKSRQFVGARLHDDALVRPTARHGELSSGYELPPGSPLTTFASLSRYPGSAGALSVETTIP